MLNYVRMIPQPFPFIRVARRLSSSFFFCTFLFLLSTHKHYLFVLPYTIYSMPRSLLDPHQPVDSHQRCILVLMGGTSWIGSV